MGFSFYPLIFEAFCLAVAMLAFVTGVQRFLAAVGAAA